MTKVFAHRGSAGESPENTVAAFLNAGLLAADGVELDVRRSGDGALVVHHDALIEGLGPISDLDVASLPGDVPLLSEVLTACGTMTVNVEIKNDPSEPGYDPTDALAQQVVDEIIELGWRSKVIISSFDRDCLDAVRRADAEIPIGWLLSPQSPVPDLFDALIRHGFDAVHPFFLFVDERFVEEARGAGVAINTWTVNARADLERMMTLGVDSVITDDVALARSIIDA
ncbi:MAG: glycerophosphodiester phosphodiesterase [Actinomycetes bacterium]